MVCASRYVGNGVSHCGLRDVGHGVWVTICGYVTVRYGCALRCVMVRYGYVTVSYASPCSKLGLRFRITIGKETLHVYFLKVSI